LHAFAQSASEEGTDNNSAYIAREEEEEEMEELNTSEIDINTPDFSMGK